MGGGLLSISGPCFDDFTMLECQFGQPEVTTNAVFASPLRAYCPIPMLTMFGSIRLNITGQREDGGIFANTENVYNASKFLSYNMQEPLPFLQRHAVSKIFDCI